MTQDAHKMNTPAVDQSQKGNVQTASKKDQQQQAVKAATSNITRLINTKSDEGHTAEDDQKTNSGSAQPFPQGLLNHTKSSVERLKTALALLQESSRDVNSTLAKVCKDQVHNARQNQMTVLETLQNVSNVYLDVMQRMMTAKNISDIMAIQMEAVQKLPALYASAFKQMTQNSVETARQAQQEATSFIQKTSQRIGSSRKA